MILGMLDSIVNEANEIALVCMIDDAFGMAV